MKKFSYERRDYESVDGRNLSYISKIYGKNNSDYKWLRKDH